MFLNRNIIELMVFKMNEVAYYFVLDYHILARFRALKDDLKMLILQRDKAVNLLKYEDANCLNVLIDECEALITFYFFYGVEN
jgi:hypothetical protein